MSSVADSTNTVIRAWVWPQLRRGMPALCAVIVLAMFASLLSIALPYLSKLIVDEGLIGRNFSLLLELCGAVIGVAVLSFVLGGVNRWLYVRTSARILFALREDAYRHLLGLPPEFYRRRAVGDLVTRLDGDVAEIQRFGTDTLLAFVNGALTLIATAGIMIFMSWPLALVAAGALPIQLALRHRARPLIAARTRAVREQASAIAQFLFETLNSVKAIQGSVAERWEMLRLQGLNRGFLHRLLAQQLLGYAIGGLSSLLSHAATAAVFVYGGYRVIHGSLTVGTLIAFVAYMTRGTGSAVSMLNLYTAYQRAAVSLERVAELLKFHAATGAGSPQGGLLPGNGHLLLDSVSLGVKVCGRALLSDCRLEVPAGRKIVIYGASGTGKSTLIDALRRFVPLDSGRIWLDGRDVDDIDLGALRRAVEVLVSEPVIFRATVLENLRYGNFDAGEADVLRAAHSSGVDQFVDALPDGYATLLGGSGQGLSTGQRQRIAVARALLRNPRVIILDEALTNLDAPAAQALHAVIDEQFARTTRIIVSHAPLLVPGSDAIYELSGGALHPRSVREHHV